MTSSDTHTPKDGMDGTAISQICGCITPTERQPDLEQHFADRAAAIVKELAQALAADPAAANPEGFAAFCQEHGMPTDNLDSGLHSLRISPILNDQQALVQYLINDYRLLEKWIIATKGPEYPSMLFGSPRCVPYFSNDRQCIPVCEFSTMLQDGLAPPFNTLLVDDGEVLRIGRAAALAGTGLERLLARYADAFLWILIFSEYP